jgi:hypothetical protein
MEENTNKGFFSKLYITYRIPLMIILLGVFSALMLFNTFNLYGKDYVSEIIKGLVDKEVVRIHTEYTGEIKKRDKQIEQLTQLVVESDEMINTLKRRLTNVEYKIKNRAIPKTPDEIRARFIQLGYTPVN